MNPDIARPGKSFKGLVQYLTHDPDHAPTQDRVEFTATRNLRTNDPEKAAKVMAWTALHADDLKRAAGEKLTGNKLKNPVYHFSLNWNPGDTPTKEEMIAYAVENLKALGLEEHEAVFVSHSDHKDRKHLHVAVNKVHPVRGVTPKLLSNDRNRLQAMAYKYEKGRGKILCTARVAKYERDPALQLEGRKDLQVRRAFEKANKDARKSKPRPEWDRDQAARIAARDRQAALDAKILDRELFRAKEIEPPYDPAKAAAAFKSQQSEDIKRQKFALWEITARNDLQNRQNEQRGILGNQWGRKRLEAEQSIEKQYGKSKREEEKRLRQRTQKLEQGNWVTRIIDRMRGGDLEREALQKGLSNIEQRSQEIRGGIESQRLASFEALEKSHRQQQLDLEQQIEKGQQNGYQIPARTAEINRQPANDRSPPIRGRERS